jgi:sugar-specific transcriptional regulator TrmB
MKKRLIAEDNKLDIIKYVKEYISENKEEFDTLCKQIKEDMSEDETADLGTIEGILTIDGTLDDVADKISEMMGTEDTQVVNDIRNEYAKLISETVEKL